MIPASAQQIFDQLPELGSMVFCGEEEVQANRVQSFLADNLNGHPAPADPDMQETLWRTARQLRGVLQHRPTLQREAAGYLRLLRPHLPVPAPKMAQEHLLSNGFPIHYADLLQHISGHAKKALFILGKSGITAEELEKTLSARQNPGFSHVPQLELVLELAENLFRFGVIGFEKAFATTEPSHLPRFATRDATSFNGLLREHLEAKRLAKYTDADVVHIGRRYPICWDLLTEEEMRFYQRLSSLRISEHSIRYYMARFDATDVDLEIRKYGKEGSKALIVEIKNINATDEDPYTPAKLTKLLLQAMRHALIVRANADLVGLEYDIVTETGIDFYVIRMLTGVLDFMDVPYRVLVTNIVGNNRWEQERRLPKIFERDFQSTQPPGSTA